MRPKKPASLSILIFMQAREEQLVLHHAMLDAGRFRLLGQGDSGVEIVRDRLLAIDVLARIDGAAEEAGAHLRGAGVEEHFVLGIAQRRFEVGRTSA